MTGPWVDGDALTPANLNAKRSFAVSSAGISTNTIAPESGSTIQVTSALSVTGPILIGGVAVGAAPLIEAGALWRTAFSTNHYYPLPPWTANLLTSNGVIGHDYYVPFYLSRTVTLDSFAVRVTSGGGAGSVVRIGLYNGDATTLKPTTLITGSSDLSTVSATLASTSVSVQLLKNTLYFVAYNAGVGSPTINAHGVSGTQFSVPPLMGVVWDLLPSTNYQMSWDSTRAHGAFVADVTGTSLAASTFGPMGFVRLSGTSIP